MFSRGRKNKFKQGLKFIGKNIKKKKDEGSDPAVDETNLRNVDSDYDDSHAAIDIDDVSNQVLVYEDNDDDETDITGGDAVTTFGPSTPQQPMLPVVVPNEPTPVAKLTDEERKARARKAVEERKKKSRMQIEARRQNKSSEAPIAVSPIAVTPEKEVAKEQRRVVSEERNRLLEEERQREQEEREMIEKEEAEMKELEEALKKEEEEAKKLAEQYKVVVETVDSEELKEDEKEEDAGKTAVEAEFEALAKREAEEARAAELAELEAELAGAAEESGVDAEKNAEDLLNQFVDIGDEKVDYVGDVNHRDSLPDLDDLLGSSTFLDEAIDGPIKFTPPASKAKKTKAAPKPKVSSRGVFKPKTRKSSTNVPKKTEKKPPTSRPLKPKPKAKPKPKPPQTTKKTVKAPSVAKRPVRKPPVKKPEKPKPKPPPVKSVTTKPKPLPKSLGPLVPPTIFRAPRKGPVVTTPVSGSCSVDSMGSQCTFNSLPICPYTQVTPDIPTCSNKYIPNLHGKLSGCQVCIFKLSPAEKEQYEKNGRHIRVAMTAGGCQGCHIFPSAEGEEPVRICRKCFFDTHLIRAYKRAAFDSDGNLMGVQKNHAKYNPVKHRYMSGRSGATVS